MLGHRAHPGPQSSLHGATTLIFPEGEVKVMDTQSCPTAARWTTHWILQARTLQWVAFPFSRGIFPTQESNPGLLHCRQILYQPSHKGPKGKLKISLVWCSSSFLKPPSGSPLCLGESPQSRAWPAGPPHLSPNALAAPPSSAIQAASLVLC